MDSMQIEKLAGKCVNSFRARILTHADSENENAEQERVVLVTQNARFNLWANNIGILI